MDSIYRVGTHGFHYAAIGVSLNPQLKITKGSKTAYADWSDKNGISWRTL